MKKLFALFFAFTLMFAISTVSAETTSPTTTISTSGNGVIEKAISPENSTTAYVLQKLEEYAKELQVPVEKMYKVVIQQQSIYAYSWLFAIGAFLIISIVLTVLCVRDHNGDSWWGVPAGSIILTIILICIGFNTMLTSFFNPEYGAMMDIFNMLK